MISYAPLWETMKRKNATTYTLQVKGEISSSTVRRLKANESVSTNTLDALCSKLESDLAVNKLIVAVCSVSWNYQANLCDKNLM